MNIGRNDPCPCGSGKKFKKCCLNNDVNVSLLELKRKIIDRWTDEKVEKLLTNEIFAKLNEMGIESDEESFIKGIKSKKSSDDLAYEWEQIYHLDIEDLSIDFVYIAVRILANRLAPDHLLVEHLNAMMQKGYKLYDQKQKSEACDIWWDLWRKTFQWLTPRQVSSIRKLDELVGTSMTQSYFNWAQDFEMALANIGQKDKRFIEILYQYATQFRNQFPKSDSLILMNMGIAAGEALFQLDRIDEAEEFFEKLIEEEYEDKTWIYVRWGDSYTEWMNAGNVNHEKAEMLYRKALDMVDNAGDRESILERIEDLNR